MNFLVLGGSSIDTILEVGEIHDFPSDLTLWANKEIETVGGTGAGKALCLAGLQQKVTLVTDLGPDVERGMIIDYFKNMNVTVVVSETDKTTKHTNLMYNKGSRISVFTSHGKLESKPTRDILHYIEDSDVVFLNINNWCRQYIPYLKELNKKVVVDLHDYDPPNPYHQDFIEVADILIVSGIHVDEEDFLNKHIKNKELVVVTKGVNGSVAIDSEGNIYNTPAYRGFNYVDSNGAGDSFVAGLITHLSNTGNIGESLKLAAMCGSVSCTTYDLYNVDYSYEFLKSVLKKEVF